MRITISNTTNLGPFDLYGSADGFTLPFLTNQTIADLNSNFTPPANTHFVIVKSTGVCNNSVLVPGVINSFPISTLTAEYCAPQAAALVDNIAYHDGGNRPLQVGDTVYTDASLTTLYNSTGVPHDYSCLPDVGIGGFINLQADSTFVLPSCK